MSKSLLTILLIILFAICFNHALLAQDEEETEVEEVVITATRTPTELDKVGGSTVHVITEEELEAKKQTQVEEILKDIPGIDIASNGGPGTSTSIYIRGAENKSTLVLIDGIMFNNPSGANRGSYLGNLTLDNIERIEVIKGSQSVLYGSNATAGVVNIITKTGKGKPVIFAGMETGSYNTYKYNVGARGSSGDFNFSMMAAQTKIGGFSIADDRNDDIPHDGNTDEKDGFENQTISAVLGYDITEDFDIVFSVRKLSSKTDLDNYGDGYVGDRIDYERPVYIARPNGDKKRHNTQEQLFYGLKLHNLFMDKSLESTLKYNVGSDYSVSYDNDNEKESTYLGNSVDLNWQGTVYIRDFQELTFGLGQFVESMTQEKISSGSTTTQVDKSLTTDSYWVQDKLILMDEDLIIVAGARNDHHAKFGGVTTYKLAPSFKVGKTGLKLKASAGTGFQAPSLFNLYSFYGDEDLKAEKSKTVDYGFEYTLAKKRYILGLTFFSSEFENQIEYAVSKYVNLDGKTKTSGYESYITANLDNVTRIMMTKVYTKAENSEGEALKRRPKDKYTLTGRTQFGDRLKTSISIQNVGKRKAYSGAKDKDGNSIEELDAYTLLNLAVSYEFNKNFEVYARIDNATDTYYEEAWSYATPGRSYYTGVKAKF